MFIPLLVEQVVFLGKGNALVIPILSTELLELVEPLVPVVLVENALTGDEFTQALLVETLEVGIGNRKGIRTNGSSPFLGLHHTKHIQCGHLFLAGSCDVLGITGIELDIAVVE